MKNTPAQLKSVLSILAFSIILAACSSGPDAESPPAIPDNPLPVPDSQSQPGPVVNVVSSSGAAERSNNQLVLGHAFDSSLSDQSSLAALNQRNGGLSLLAFDQSADIDLAAVPTEQNPKSVVSADEGLIKLLNTEWELEPLAEKTVYVSSDVVSVYDHIRGTTRDLLSLPHTICEILPSEKVEQVLVDGTLQVRYLHRDEVYVVTSDGSCEGLEAADRVESYRYYRLPLNYKRQVSENELCASSGGSNFDPDACFVNSFDIVTEPEARAELIMGWLESDSAGDYDLVSGYLGHGVVGAAQTENPAGRLSFFNDARELVWSIPRDVQLNTVSPSLSEIEGVNVFNVKRLGNQDSAGFVYLVQLSRDVFVFDASTELFSLPVERASEFLSDRVLRTDLATGDEAVGILLREVESVSNDSDVVLRDGSKIYSYDFSSKIFSPTPLPSIEFVDDLSFFESFPYENKRTFSQFDYGKCEELVRLNSGQDSDASLETDEQFAARVRACLIAHDVPNLLSRQPDDLGTNVWRFLSECDSALGCTVPAAGSDFCLTEAELLSNPLLAGTQRECSTAFFDDLNELDSDENDPDFVGYVQYNQFINDLDMLMLGDQLLFQVEMLENDLLVKVDYSTPVDASTDARESVLLGGSFAHFGMNTYQTDDGLFIDLLRPNNSFVNECYKNYHRVDCNFSDSNNLELRISGAAGTCTAYDLTQGACTQRSSTFEPFALYCSADSVETGTCTEQTCSQSDLDAGTCDLVSAPIHNLRVEKDLNLFGKWLPVESFGSAEGEDIFLVAVSDEDDVEGEGVLLTPSLYEIQVDDSTGDVGLENAVLRLDTEIESNILAQRYLTSVGLGFENRLSIASVTKDVVPIVGGSGSRPSSELVFLNVDLPSSSVSPPLAPPVSSLQFLRVETNADSE